MKYVVIWMFISKIMLYDVIIKFLLIKDMIAAFCLKAV